MEGDTNVESGKPFCAVIYLARGRGNGLARAIRFFESYDKHPAGLEHDLVIAAKGWEGVEGLDAVRGYAGRYGARVVELPDDGFDLGAYFRVGNILPHQYLCFLNSSSHILSDNWLYLLQRPLMRSKIGIASCSGGWGSTAQLRLDYAFCYIRNAELLRLLRLPRKWFRTLFVGGVSRPLFGKNPHVRTNAFIVKNELWHEFSVTKKIPLTKWDCYTIEHGRNGLSRFVESLGKEYVVVGADGKEYNEEEWPESKTFLGSDISNLLVGDNQSDLYLSLPPEARAVSQYNAWGKALSDKGYSPFSLAGALNAWSDKILRFILPRYARACSKNRRLETTLEALQGKYEEADWRTAPIRFRKFPEDAADQPPAASFFDPPLYVPLRAAVCRGLAPRLNILLPSTRIAHNSGGPNTAYALGGLLAKRGVSLRFVSTSIPADQDPSAIRDHIAALGGLSKSQASDIKFADGRSKTDNAVFGSNDLFLATAWWTVHALGQFLHKFSRRKFLYLIQDYEPWLYPASSDFLHAEATYALDYLPIFNSSLLRDFFLSRRVGRFADDAFARESLSFEPAVDRRLFYKQEDKLPGCKKRLLFYARPQARRNLLDMGVAALVMALKKYEGDLGEWEFFSTDSGVAGRCRRIVLEERTRTEISPIEVRDLATWAREMRATDVLLSLIMSPHTSYPPLEGVACGALVVTNTYAVKTAERLKDISGDISPCEPNARAIAETILEVMRRIDRGERGGGALSSPASWEDSFSPILPRLLSFLKLNGIESDA